MRSKNKDSLRRVRWAMWAVAAAAAVPLVGCGGGGGDSGGAAPPPPAAAPPGPNPTNTSYLNYKNIGLVPQTLPAGDKTVRAYGNFSGTAGATDFFRAVSTYDLNLPPEQATPGRFEFWTKQNGTWVLDAARLPVATGCIQPGKALVGDFNGDGRPDVFVACYGYNKAPYPGERNKIVLSQPNGTYVTSDASTDVGFHAGASAADLNGDNRLDVIVTNNYDPNKAYTLINNGSGQFTREATSRLPTAIRPTGANLRNYFAVELVDVNEDGWLDLVMGGHEYEGAPTSVFLNNGDGTNNFANATATVIPQVQNEGVVLDFTVTGTGATRAIWVVRTSGNDGTFYQGRTVQKVTWPGLVSTLPLNDRNSPWIPALIPATVNNAAVVTSDNNLEAVSFPQ